MIFSHPFRASAFNNTGSMTFQLLASGSNSGYTNLFNSPNIQFNSTGSIISPTAIWLGEDATVDSWTDRYAGFTLTTSASSGIPVTASQAVPFTNNTEKCVQFYYPDGGQYYQLTNNTDLDIGTGSFIIETVFQARAGGNNIFLGGKYNGGQRIFNIYGYNK